MHVFSLQARQLEPSVSLKTSMGLLMRFIIHTPVDPVKISIIEKKLYNPQSVSLQPLLVSGCIQPGFFYLPNAAGIYIKKKYFPALE
jgi:hypothetical protein